MIAAIMSYSDYLFSCRMLHEVIMSIVMPDRSNGEGQKLEELSHLDGVSTTPRSVIRIRFI